MMRTRIEIPRVGERGFVLIIALIGLLTLTFLLLTGSITSATSMKVSGNYVKTVDAFNIAEAGIARARPLLENTDFDSLLTTYLSTPLINTTSFNGGSYKVTLMNDDKDLASGGTTTNDTNNIVKIISEGTSASGAKSTITNYIQLVGGTNPISFPGSPPGGASVGVICGTGTQITAGGSAAVDGDDYDAPNLPCTGAGCNGTHLSSNTYDLIVENTLATCTGACASSTKQTNVGNALNCSGWRTLNNQLAALSSSNPNVVVLTGSEVTTGNDCTTPKIFIISTTETSFKIKGNLSMCGIFVVASDTTLTTSGTVTLEGLMLFMGGNSGTKGITFDPGGTANFYGKMVFGSAEESNTKLMDLSGNTTFNYSTEAMASAQVALNQVNAGGGAGGTGQLLGVGWEESY